jgi:two-component system chemotaxis response regulator CheB
METKEVMEASCPDCRGPLSEVRQDDLREYRCMIGHAYSPHTLLQAHSEAEERILWAAVVALEEARTLVRAVADEFSPEVARRLAAQGEDKHRLAQELRAILQRLETFQTE